VDGALEVIGYLRRLARSLAAYQVADVVSKFIAVLLLPVYTRYINPRVTARWSCLQTA